MKKPATLIAVILLALIAVGHLLRLLVQWEIIVGGVRIPMWGSIVVAILYGVAVVLLWRERI